jgi:hypothetical protein
MSKSFRDVIAEWDSPDALAKDVGANAERVRKWKQRDSIPAEYWLRLSRAAAKRGKPIELHELAVLADRSLPGAAR